MREHAASVNALKKRIDQLQVRQNEREDAEFLYTSISTKKQFTTYIHGLIFLDTRAYKFFEDRRGRVDERCVLPVYVWNLRKLRELLERWTTDLFDGAPAGQRRGGSPVRRCRAKRPPTPPLLARTNQDCTPLIYLLCSYSWRLI